MGVCPIPHKAKLACYIPRQFEPQKDGNRAFETAFERPVLEFCTGAVKVSRD